MKPPAFQFYADDFLAGTMDMAPDELGIYIRLLCFQWNRGSLPADPVRLSRLAGCDVPEIVLEKFTADESGQLINRRLESERLKQSEYREKQRQNGCKGGRKPKPNPTLNPEQTDGKPKPNPSPKGSQSSPSPSPSPSPKVTERESNAGAEIPTLEDIRKAAANVGATDDQCRAFFDHYEGNSLWTNQHGRMINVPIKLKAWVERDRTMGKSGKLQPEYANAW